MKIFLRTLATITLVVINITIATGQLKNYVTENENWSYGVAKLTDRIVLKGEFNFNFIPDVLRYRDQNDSNPYSARTVNYFIQKDKKSTLERTYYAIPYNDDENGKRIKSVFLKLFIKKEI